MGSIRDARRTRSVPFNLHILIFILIITGRRAIGSFPDPSDVFPSKRPRADAQPQHMAPSASGVGFFTPPAASGSGTGTGGGMAGAGAAARVFGGGVTGFKIDGPRDSLYVCHFVVSARYLQLVV